MRAAIKTAIARGWEGVGQASLGLALGMTLGLTLAIGGSSAALAGEIGVASEVRLGFGTSDNPLRLADAPRSSAYAPFGLRFDLTGDTFRDGAFRLRFDADGTRHLENSTSDADETSLGLAARWQWVERDGKTRRESLAVTLRATQDDGTYLRRGTEDEIVIEEGGTPFGLADRFDKRIYALEGDWRLRRGASRVALSLDLQKQDYLEDYESLADIDSLDHDRARLVAGYDLELVPDRFVAGVEGRYGVRWYDERRVRFADGTRFLGDTEELRESEARASLRYTPEPRGGAIDRLAFQLEYRFARRVDPFDGYLDRDRDTWRLEANARIAKRVSLELDLRRADSTYDNLIGASLPAPVLLAIDEREAELTLAFETPWIVGVELSARYTDSRSTNPLWSYDELAAHAVLVWRFERVLGGGGSMDEE